MEASNKPCDQASQSQSTNTRMLHQESDLKSELKAFDNTKTGVKGLVGSGISSLPRMFITNDNDNNNNTIPCAKSSNTLAVRIIDLEGLHDPLKRKQILQEIKYACEEWGFFQVVNHGVPISVLNAMLNAVRGFHEQDDEAKKPFYSRDETSMFKYFSSFALYSGAVANWKDSFSCKMDIDNHDPSLLPEVLRDTILEYTKQVKKLGIVILELFCEVLGLGLDHLKDMKCAEGMYIHGHYYPPCPEPELAMGTSSHTDSCFFTILLQDNTGGLQVLHQNQWVNVDPVLGALVINIGDLLQLLTNARFKSVIHRVLALGVGPRISTACFFRTQDSHKSLLYGPIKELLCEDNPPIYKDTTVKEYLEQFHIKG